MADNVANSSTLLPYTEENPSPAKRQRVEPGAGVSRPPPGTSPRPSSALNSANGTQPTSDGIEVHKTRFSSKPSVPRGMESYTHFKDARRTALVALICQRDDPTSVIDLLREIATDPSPSSNTFDVDTILDEKGHSALHLAASMGRMQTVEALISSGADIHRGNYLGETPLIRACLATHNSDHQTFHTLVMYLHPSIRTLDTSKKSVIHHIISLAGVKGRAVVARYYLDQIFFWIAQHEGGDFRSIVDLQDDNGDTGLCIAARVGNRSLVRTLLDVGANRLLPNKLGMRPGDFGVESEV